MAKKKILVVDDSRMLLEVYKDVLEAAGFDVITRSTPFGTSSVIAEERPDVVLMDIFMPALQGDKIVEVVKKDRRIRDTKMLLFSNRSHDELKSIAASCGADGFIPKSANHDEFVRLVRGFAPTNP